MANRYGNRNYERSSDYREGYASRPSEYDRGRYDYDRERYGSEYGGYGSSREENYRSGRQQYGQGYTGSDYGRGSYNRDYDEDYYTGSYQSGRGMGRGEYDRERYGSSYGNRYGQSEYGGYSSGRGSYGSDYGNYSDMGRDYPSSYSSGRGYNERSYRGGMERGREYDRERYGGSYNREDRGWLDKASDEVSSWFGDEEAARRREMDQRQGQHRGRGPRNYRRSDERIKEDINDRLTDHNYLDASDIDVEVNNGEVTLTGTVDSRYAKRMAEDIAEEVSGVSNVENRLRINQSSYGQGGSSITGTSGKTGTSTTGTTGTTGSTATGTAAGATGMTDTTTGKSRTKAASS